MTSRHSTIRKEVQRSSAEQVITPAQLTVLSCIALAVVVGLVADYHKTLVTIIGLLLVFMAIFVGTKNVLWWASNRYRFDARVMVNVTDPTLPHYTVLVPLFREANMVPGLVKALGGMHYPREKLQIVLLLEEEDKATQEAAYAALLEYGREHFEVLVVPEDHPQTKPRALNAGLEAAKGEYITIYDAEDRPDPLQLLRAVASFRHASSDVACFQARLQFCNERASLITRFYRAEYCVHFEWVLPGLAKLGLIQPLGGTSNHFRTDVVRAIGGWDPYNVTEDADMAGALAMYGYRVESFDSFTFEEASERARVADKQRRRWLMGYAITGLAYTRHPLRQARQMGVRRWFFFNLFMLGTPFSLVINPIFWAMTITYMVTRSPAIEALWPGPLYAVGLTLMLVGNLLLFYQMMAACLKQEGFSSVKYMLLLPLWWAFASFSAYMMLYELVFHPHRWNKTEHQGHAYQTEEELQAVEDAA